MQAVPKHLHRLDGTEIVSPKEIKGSATYMVRGDEALKTKGVVPQAQSSTERTMPARRKAKAPTDGRRGQKPPAVLAPLPGNRAHRAPKGTGADTDTEAKRGPAKAKSPRAGRQQNKDPAAARNKYSGKPSAVSTPRSNPKSPKEVKTMLKKEVIALERNAFQTLHMELMLTVAQVGVLSMQQVWTGATGGMDGILGPRAYTQYVACGGACGACGAGRVGL